MPVKINDFVIINYFDKPCTRLTAEVIVINGERVTARYITEETTLKFCSGPISEVTPVSAFGVELAFHNGYVEGIQTGQSSATYADGRPRTWQPDYDGERYKLRQEASQ